MALGNPITIPVADLPTVMESYNRIRLYKASSQAGVYSLLDTIVLVAGTNNYPYQDTAGLSTDWYRYSFFQTSDSSESAQSDPQPAGGTAIYDRQALRRMVAHKMSLYGYPRTNYTHPGPAGITTAVGTTTSVIAAGHINNRVPSNFYSGWFLLANNNAAAGQEREVDDGGFTNSTGAFAMATPFSAALGSGTNFDLYGEIPSSDWNIAIDDARRRLWLPFRIPVAGVNGQTVYGLPDFITRGSQISTFRQQQGALINEYQYGVSYRPELIENDGGGLSLYLSGGISENAVWYLEGRAHPTEFLSDTSTIPLADDVLDYFLAVCCQKVSATIGEALLGAGEDRSVWERKASYWEDRARGLESGLRLGPKPVSAFSSRIVSVGPGQYDLPW